MQRLSIDPSNAYLRSGDKCSYMLSVDNFQPGDYIEIYGVHTHLTDLTLFFGGYSPISSNKSLKLTNGKKYMLDGSQQLFVILNVTAEDASEKPYF